MLLAEADLRLRFVQRGPQPVDLLFQFRVPVAAGLLYPFTGLLLSPMLASAAMSLSSVSVISNALRLRAWHASC